jgi:hypothetical protein
VSSRTPCFCHSARTWSTWSFSDGRGDSLIRCILASSYLGGR